ncbi:hypothetical protein EVJ58_g11102 [Rhodofomes roseus]|uniref:Uncharacterized protein n=1 Tax=Rhodofomes roseus TaxID=34475 RepID=A0A4Y9XLT2_9APHY|nr:hypothetical protein EVJ58_g11102 [Rhodofomes roseus]
MGACRRPPHGGAVQPKTSAPEMYQTGYPVAPVFVPTAGLAAPSKAVTSNIINQVAFPSQAYSNPMQGYNDFGPYPVYDARSPPPANANAYQPAGTLAPRPGPTYNNGYGATAGAASAAAAPAGPPVRKASQRKQVPPLNLSATRDDASPPAYQITPVTGNNASPMLANPYGTTPNLADPPLSAVSPHPKRGSKSLLNSPVHLAYSDEGASVDGDKASEKPRSRTNSYSRMLDPGLPQMPVAAPLPDEFGAQGDAAVKDEKAAVRQLTVRNE